MKPRYYIGLDVHKRKIGGKVYAEGTFPPQVWIWNSQRPLPVLRPERAAYGVAGLRSASGQGDARHALIKSYCKRANG
jgi:hypothetical protein